MASKETFLLKIYVSGRRQGRRRIKGEQRRNVRVVHARLFNGPRRSTFSSVN